MLHDELLNVQEEHDEADSSASVETAMPNHVAGPEGNVNNSDADQEVHTFPLSYLEDPDLNTPIVLGPFYNGNYAFSALLPTRMYGLVVEPHSLANSECYIIDPIEFGRILLTNARSQMEPNRPVTEEEINSVAHKLCLVLKLSWCMPQLVQRPIHGHLLVVYAMDRVTGDFIGCMAGKMVPEIDPETQYLSFLPIVSGICPNTGLHQIVFKAILHLVVLIRFRTGVYFFNGHRIARYLQDAVGAIESEEAVSEMANGLASALNESSTTSLIQIQGPLVIGCVVDRATGLIVGYGVGQYQPHPVVNQNGEYAGQAWHREVRGFSFDDYDDSSNIVARFITGIMLRLNNNNQ
ncbi:GL21754 [Drosophila persimilis]|uniref:GL21754 n=1 Tax=Drosophila persimilis TaxID=7234 RepID=B4GER4_DROPE|nr:GL21754 [Drosophila persimilis]